MKTILPILLCAILFASCRKELVTKPIPIDQCSVLEMERPALQIMGVPLSSTEVQITWSKKGKSTYTVQKRINDQWINQFTCQCSYFRQMVSEGSHTYRVITGNIISNVVTINTSVLSPPPVPEADTILIAFDPVYIEYWSAFLFDTTLLGSGVEQWKRDSIMSHVNRAFDGHGITFVTQGTASQVAILTQSSDWYGLVGGVSFQGSYGTGKQCFIFTALLQYDWKFIAKALIHELGHTLGLYHTQNLGLETNWMSYVYMIPQRFETVVDVFGVTVNQPQVINQTLN